MPPREWPTSSTGSSAPMPAWSHRLEDALLVGVRPGRPSQSRSVSRSRTSSSWSTAACDVVGAGQVDDVPHGPSGAGDRLDLDGAVGGGVRAGDSAATSCRCSTRSRDRRRAGAVPSAVGVRRHDGPAVVAVQHARAAPAASGPAEPGRPGADESGRGPASVEHVAGRRAIGAPAASAAPSGQQPSCRSRPRRPRTARPSSATSRQSIAARTAIASASQPNDSTSTPSGPAVAASTAASAAAQRQRATAAPTPAGPGRASPAARGRPSRGAGRRRRRRRRRARATASYDAARPPTPPRDVDDLRVRSTVMPAPAGRRGSQSRCPAAAARTGRAARRPDPAARGDQPGQPVPRGGDQRHRPSARSRRSGP